MWSVENMRSDEARKIQWETVPYFHGQILDIGLTRFKTFPHWVGVGSNRDVRIKDHDNLSVFASNSWDGVFSAFLLDQVPIEDWSKTLTEWCRPIKQGGHLMLYLPDAEQYPKAGSGQGDPEHRVDVSYDNVVAAMDSVPRSWDLVDYQKRSADDEYSLWFAFKCL